MGDGHQRGSESEPEGEDPERDLNHNQTGGGEQKRPLASGPAIGQKRDSNEQQNRGGNRRCRTAMPMQPLAGLTGIETSPGRPGRCHTPTEETLGTHSCRAEASAEWPPQRGRRSSNGSIRTGNRVGPQHLSEPPADSRAAFEIVALADSAEP